MFVFIGFNSLEGKNKMQDALFIGYLRISDLGIWVMGLFYAMAIFNFIDN